MQRMPLGEEEIRAELERRDLSFTSQYKVARKSRGRGDREGHYLVDLALPPIAVEVQYLGSPHEEPGGVYGLYGRLKWLVSQGWYVIYLHPQTPIRTGTQFGPLADQVLSYRAEVLSSKNPPPYRHVSWEWQHQEKRFCWEVTDGKIVEGVSYPGHPPDPPEAPYELVFKSTRVFPSK